MKNYILIVVLILAMVFFAFAIFYYAKNPGQIKENKNPEISSNVINNQDINNNQGNESSGTVSGRNTEEGSSGGILGGGSDGSDAEGVSSGNEQNLPLNNITNPLPEDAYTVPCGMYYKGYQFCNGTCEEGVCVSENRSCYCKKLY